MSRLLQLFLENTICPITHWSAHAGGLGWFAAVSSAPRKCLAHNGCLAHQVLLLKHPNAFLKNPVFRKLIFQNERDNIYMFIYYHINNILYYNTI